MRQFDFYAAKSDFYAIITFAYVKPLPMLISANGAAFITL